MKILFIGDIVGRPGRQMVTRHLASLVDRHLIDLVVANAENAAAGFGVTPDVASELLSLGVDVLTTGNHVWDKRESLAVLDQEQRLLRPANYPPGLPGKGWGVFHTSAELPRLGCVVLVQARDDDSGRIDEGVAQLRLLIVEPAARGIGLGARFVRECTEFARAAGYRRVRLWTQSHLDAARRLYLREGYTRVASEPHHSFGHDLVAEFWELALA